MLREELAISIDETQKDKENEKSNIGDDECQYESSKLFSNKDVENLQVVITEIPIDNVSKEKKEISDTANTAKYTVAYNYGRNQQAAQGPFAQIPPPNFNGGNGMGPPLDYDPATRNDFVKLVLSLVLLMLVVTAGFLAFVLTTPSVKEFFRTSGWTLSLFAIMMLLGLNYAIVCSPCTRYPPGNFLLLILTVFAMSIIAAHVTSRYKTEIVLYATVATAAVVFVCVLLSFSKFDFTSWMLYVVVIGTAFSVIAMIVLLTMLVTGTVMKPIILVILIVGTLIEVIMLTIQLQTILGGRSVELSESDYALGAYMLYTSIVSIFIKLVQILGILNES